MSRIDIINVETITFDEEDFEQLERKGYVFIKSTNLDKTILVRK